MNYDVLRNYKFKLGMHCSSTVLMNLLNYWGYDLSESLSFGIGGGLGFVYFKYKTFDFPYVSGRSDQLIEKALNNLGFSGEFVTGSKENILKKIDSYLASGYPVIITSDLNKIKYIRDLLKFDTFYPFSVHHLMITGKNNDEYYMKDHLWEERVISQNLLVDILHNDKLKPFPLTFNMLDYGMIPGKIEKKDLSMILKRSIEINSREMLYPFNPINRYSGIKGMMSFFDDYEKMITSGLEIEQLKKNIKYIYIPLEKIGTGGGNFRRLYSTFLKEASQVLKMNKISEISEKYRKLSIEWKSFSLLLENAYENENFNELECSIKQLKEIINLEKKTINALYDITKEF